MIPDGIPIEWPILATRQWRYGSLAVLRLSANLSAAFVSFPSAVILAACDQLIISWQN